jgi:hypothetical protein
LGFTLWGRCTNAAGYSAWLFDGGAYPGDYDFIWSDLYDVSTRTQAASPAAVPYTAQIIDRPRIFGAPSDILTWLWRKAAAEWT